MVLLWLIPKWYTILEDFFLLDSVRYHGDVKATLKVWLVQSQEPDVKLISQIDIVMRFIYNIIAMSWRYRGWCHSNIVTISECPLGYHWLCIFIMSHTRLEEIYNLCRLIECQGTPLSKQARHLKVKRLQRDSNLQPLSS